MRAPLTATDEAIAEIAPEVLEVVNGMYGDSIEFVARVLGGGDRLVAAEAVGVDTRGLRLRIVDRSGARHVWVDFPEPVDDPDELSAHVFDLVDHARVRSGEPGETSAERERKRARAARTFVTSVSAVRPVHPHLVRITLAGGDLASFAPLGPDTFVYVLLPPTGRADLTIGADFTWERAESMPEDERPVAAYYTVRDWRPDTAELDLLFVLHDAAGPASAWATHARPGDPVALWGPRDAFAPPRDTEWYLLVGDDTGLPAIAAILESLPHGTPALVVAEVDGPDEHQDLPVSATTQVTWVHRDGARPGTVPGRTVDAVRGLDLPPGRGYVWGGGESRTMTRVRRYVRDALGLPRNGVSLVAYWRHVDSDANSDIDS